MWNYKLTLKFRTKIKEQFVTYDIICVMGWVSSHMWDTISVPYAVRMRKAERMHSKEKRSKTNVSQVQR